MKEFQETSRITHPTAISAQGVTYDGSTTDSLIHTINSANASQFIATLTSINDDGITLNFASTTTSASYKDYTFIFFG